MNHFYICYYLSQQFVSFHYDLSLTFANDNLIFPILMLK